MLVNFFVVVDINSPEYGKLKLFKLPWYCPISTKEMPFSSLSNKELNMFLILSRNHPHPSAQAVRSKKFDKDTKVILKNLKDLNKLFDHAENVVGYNYFDIKVGLSRSRKFLPNQNFPQSCSKKYHHLFVL